MKKFYIFFAVLLSTIVYSRVRVLAQEIIVPPQGDSTITNIIGGANTNINTVRWQVLLEIAGSDGCGGTIIAPNWILTACHCLETSSGVFYQTNQVRVYAGITRRSQKSTGQLRTVSQIIRHASYNRTTYDNDIALLRLSSPLTFNTNVQGIQYATANDATAGLTNPGRLGLISGWGWTNNTGPQPDNLQSVTLPIISNADAISRGSNVTANMIALAQNGRGAAPGDSGGPMVVNGNILAGVCSWGNFPKDLNPTIYTRVSNYCDWIADRIAAIENGANVLCTSNVTYNLRHGPATGATVSWSATPANLFATSTGTGTAATLRAASSSARGQGTLTFTITGGCGTTTVSRTFRVGSSITFSWAGTGPYGQVDVMVSGGSPPYNFYRNGSFIYTSHSSSTTVPFGCDGGTLRVEASTPCGIASASSNIPSGCAPPPHMVVYPNPTSSEIFVAEFQQPSTNDSGEPEESCPSTEDIRLELYDFDATMVRDKSFSGRREEWKMDVSDLKKGTYVLRVVGKEVDETHQVIVE